MPTPYWIWQHHAWPTFTWQTGALASLLRACAEAQGRLLGMAGAVEPAQTAHQHLDALLQNILTSSAIEGEQLNLGSVRSSLARRLGVPMTGAPSPRSEGLASLLLDATGNYDQPLTLTRLFTWHGWLFPDEHLLLATHLRVGELRGSEPMQVVSGRLDQPTVHFEAPPRDGLEAQMNRFLAWFASSQADQTLDPFLRAGIAHFWCVTLHPFDDGNGRLTRALTDLALAQADNQGIRLYAMSASILEDRAGYYRVLESSQKGDLDITEWLRWFLNTLLASQQSALMRIERVVAKARFWQTHRGEALASEQLKVLNRLLGGGEAGFEEGISARQYQAVAKVSKATATRHLADLLARGYLHRLPGGGRSTRYHLNR
jgi:Fic family protein